MTLKDFMGTGDFVGTPVSIFVDDSELITLHGTDYYYDDETRTLLSTIFSDVKVKKFRFDAGGRILVYLESDKTKRRG